MRVATSLFAGIFLVTATVAQAQPLSNPRDAATDARLDPLFAARDWKSLEAILTRPADLATMGKQLDWMKRHTYEDGNFFISLMYASNLWVLSQANPEYASLSQSAGLFLLYTIALIRVDGAACEDKSAPQRRLDQIMTWHEPVLKAMKALPDARKTLFAASAASLERSTSTKRAERDEAICSGGLSQLAAGLASGNPPEAGPQVGLPGNTVVVTPPDGWRPAFLSEERYKADQAVIRKDMLQALLALVK